ncbi:flavin reductase family protein [Streptomyces griseomycini]|uniref:Flavin reductase (DIM6/NTAB) family NADH-FMN oxidoreductase RutF n=1 Tax=Streptomyces griseomycini TaxID=66895 RepID=A0A7W7V9F5_9ACTN|nr:flavin reductase family protein [Streptomyces griseomycini]MBB4901875.1 flavin reductase (DIM6/NTAB) family NADH-FMN oxidoreductase RutF [Streptomyces griseomycini]
MTGLRETSPPLPARRDTDAKELRRAFAEFATGVTVVTVGEPSPRGMTANSFTSVSLNPPLLLVCVHNDAVMQQALHPVRHFGVSVLGAAQEAEARHFADHSRPAGLQQFDAVGWSPGATTSVPLIDGALARFECEKWRVYDGGDHTILVGAVVSWSRASAVDAGAAEAGAGRNALLYFRGRFQQHGFVAEGPPR